MSLFLNHITPPPQPGSSDAPREAPPADDAESFETHLQRQAEVAEPTANREGPPTDEGSPEIEPAAEEAEPSQLPESQEEQLPNADVVVAEQGRALDAEELLAVDLPQAAQTPGDDEAVVDEATRDTTTIGTLPETTPSAHDVPKRPSEKEHSATPSDLGSPLENATATAEGAEPDAETLIPPEPEVAPAELQGAPTQPTSATSTSQPESAVLAATSTSQQESAVLAAKTSDDESTAPDKTAKQSPPSSPAQKVTDVVNAVAGSPASLPNDPQAATSHDSKAEPVAEVEPAPAPAAPADGRGDSQANSPQDRFTRQLMQGGGDRTGRPTGTDELSQTRFVDRVARAFRVAGGEGGAIKLRLHPPELGMLQVQLKVQGQVLTAKLEAETPAARALLMDSLPVLRDRLAEQGVRIEQFDVDLMDQQPRHTPDDPGQRSAGEPHPEQSSALEAGDDEPPVEERNQGFDEQSQQLNIIV